MRTPAEFQASVAAGLAAIRTQFQVPAGFPPSVLDAAHETARRPPPTDRPDRTDLAMMTLDPASSTDLDQAFALELDGDVIVLHYAIADVGWFVAPGSPLDVEAWKRGVTIYLPDGKAGLYPPELAEGAASLLPDGPRPAVVLSVGVDPAGVATLRSAARAMVRSRAKLGYEHLLGGELPALLTDLAARVTAAEDRRGASRVEFPEQEVVPDSDRPGAYRLDFRDRRPVEDENATMSLAANLAVANTLLAAGTGLFRTMAPPDAHGLRVLHRTATALGLAWPDGADLAAMQTSLPPGPRSAAFLLAVRRAGGGAGYTPYRAGVVPFHAAIAAQYVHATAPLRRLADRYVLEAACAVSAGVAVPGWVTDAFERLPATMVACDGRASKVDRAVVDLTEAATLSGREGERFEATIVELDDRGAKIQLHDSAVVAHVDHPSGEPGDPVSVTLAHAEPLTRRVEFTINPPG